MKKEIKYICFYDLPASRHKRVSSIAAVNKIDYISDVINRAGFNVHIVSPSWYNDNAQDAGYQPQTTVQINTYKRVTFGPSFGTKSKFIRNIKIIYSLLWLIYWLIKNTKRNEKILAYHTPWLAIPIIISKKIKRFKLILEVEEIYSDVNVTIPFFEGLEKKLLYEADAYIFSTELLYERINKKNRPYIIIYGVYKVYPKMAKPLDDGKIHLLYAGIIDSQKGGAFNAVECTRFLTEKYVLHISGFGETEKIKKLILKLNSTNLCKIYFDGIKYGEDFIKYCQSKHIGLNTQKSNGKYVNSSFPSKILTYLGLGLLVISCPIECVKKSLINDFVIYYEEDTPESIAKTIMSVNLSSEFDNTGILGELDKKCVDEMKNILK